MQSALYTEHGNLPTMVSCKDIEQEAAWVVFQVQQFLAQGVPSDEIAILSRTAKYLDTFQSHLSAATIPFFYREKRVDSSPLIKDILSYFGLYLVPTDLLSLSRILSHVPYIGPKTIQRLLDGLHKDMSMQDVFNHFLAFKPRSNQQRSWTAFLTLFHALVRSETPEPELLDKLFIYLEPYLLREYPQQYTNLIKERLGVYLFSAEDIRDYLESYMLGANTTEEQQNGVVLSTVHSAKGLQYKVVFVVGLAHGIFPSRYNNNPTEERNLYYVACTRAKEYLYLTWPMQINKHGKNEYAVISPFLRNIPVGLFTTQQAQLSIPF